MQGPELGSILTAASELGSFCTTHGWKHCFIGGLAIQRWGEPRLTMDADLTLLTGFGNEESFVDKLLASFAESRSGARAIALHQRVLFIRASNGIRLDVALAAIDFEQRSISRATLWQPVDGVSLMTCSAEDLIVHKAYANRDKDWGDIGGILLRQGAKLDIALVFQELRPFVETIEEPEILSRLERMLKKQKLL
jgi:hypothetical protein